MIIIADQILNLQYLVRPIHVWTVMPWCILALILDEEMCGKIGEYKAPSSEVHGPIVQTLSC